MLPPAKSLDDMQAVVTNSTVDGVLAALFAALIIIVILDAARIWFKAIRAREPLPTTEAEYVASQLFAPAGLFRPPRSARCWPGPTAAALRARRARDHADGR